MMRTDFAQTRRKHTLGSAHTSAQIFAPMLTHRHQHWHWRRHTLTTHTIIVYMHSCWRVLRSTVSGARMFVVVSCHHWSTSVFWSPSRLTQTARSPRRARRRVPVVTSAVGRKPCLQQSHRGEQDDVVLRHTLPVFTLTEESKQRAILLSETGQEQEFSNYAPQSDFVYPALPYVNIQKF